MLQSLLDEKARFVLVGGLAMVVHGSAHVTDDLDICYARDDINLSSVVRALKRFRPRLRGVPPNLPFLWDDQALRMGMNFTLDTELGAIDLLGFVTGIGEYEDVIVHARTASLYGFDVPVLTLDALIKAKEAAGRPKDKLHLLELEEIRKLRDRQ
jgi:hypothetical protein